MIFGAATLVAVGAAAFFLFQTEQQIARLKSTLRAFDGRAREATTALADLRVAQQAYVAEGKASTTGCRKSRAFTYRLRVRWPRCGNHR